MGVRLCFIIRMGWWGKKKGVLHLGKKECQGVMDQFALGRYLRKVRESQGLNREQLAELCGISPTHIRQMETGTRLPSVPVLVTLSNKLMVSPIYFLQKDLKYLALGLPDPYDRMIDLLLKMSPKDADVLTAVIDVMSKRIS